MDFKKIALFLLGIIAVLAFFSFMGLSEIVAIISGADMNYILLSFAMEILILFMLSVKFRAVINSQGRLSLVKGGWSAGKYKGIKFTQVTKATIVGLMTSFITPIARVGGEPVKIYLLRKNDIKIARSTAIVAVDAFTELLSYYIIVLISIVFILLAGQIPYSIVYPFILILGFSSVMLVIFFVMCFNYSILCRVVKFINWVVSKLAWRFSRKSIDSKKDHAWVFYDIFRLVMTNKLSLLKIMAYAFAVRFFEFMRMYYIFKAFSYDISLFTIVLAWSIILLIGIIPFLPGGLGLIEAGGTYAFILFGVSKPLAGAVMAIDRLFSYWFVIILGFFVIWLEKISPQSIKRRVFAFRTLLISFARNIYNAVVPARFRKNRKDFWSKKTFAGWRRRIAGYYRRIRSRIGS